MFKMLVRIFLPKDKDISSPIVRKRYGMLCALYGIVTNLLMAFGKIVFGYLMGSIAILADGINNLMDGASSLITMISFKLSAQPADNEHPYGHQRMEYVGSLIISFIMFYVGIYFADSSIRKIVTPEPIDLGQFWWVIGLLVFAITMKLSQVILYRQGAKAIDSLALKASGQDSFNDILITSTVLVSMLTLKFINVNVDGIIGFLVSLFILYQAIVLIKNTISLLLGEAPSKETIVEIHKKIQSYPGVLGVHDLLIHSYGPNKTFISVHVEVDANVDIMTNHDIIDHIEHDFLTKSKINMVIHMDPVDHTDEVTIALQNEVTAIIQTIDERIQLHDFRKTRGTTIPKLIFDVVVPDRFPIKDEELRHEIIAKIKQVYPNYIIILTIDHHYFE